jgi:zinc transport system substrate-binding protein
MGLSRLGLVAAVGAVGCLALSAPALAKPVVVTDIPPVHALVARVMQGVGEPTQILPPGASPHGYAMRPSEAAALADADVVFWVGPELTPWLARAIDTLATHAEAVELLEAPGTTHLAFREGATFEVHHHDEDGHDAHAEGEEEEHADAHEDADAAEDHDQDEAHEHDHHGVDPHAWLDPDNGKAWLSAIANELATVDPDNADAYRSNAAAGAREFEGLTARISEQLRPVRGAPFVVFHDAYHYFENRFDIEAAGAVSLSDASRPGPARVSEIRDRIRDLDAVCVFTEPQFQPTLVATIVEGTSAHVATLDPLGTSLEPGPTLYPALLQHLADDLTACLD